MYSETLMRHPVFKDILYIIEDDDNIKVFNESGYIVEEFNDIKLVFVIILYFLKGYRFMNNDLVSV